MVSSFFTDFDYKILDIILSFINEFELIRRLSLKYEFFVTRENISMEEESDKYIQVKNLEVDQTFEIESIPYGKLVNNKFTWHVDWVRVGVKYRIDEICNLHNLSNEVRNTFYKFISSNSINFENNYSNVIPIFLTLISEPSKYNLIIFEPENNIPNHNWNVYHIMHVPLTVPEIVSTKINTIFNELKNL